MRKLIIFLALIACGLATWAPSHGHQQQHQQHPQGPNQLIARHETINRRAAETKHRHQIGVAPHGGQMESVHHGGGTVFPDKEFRRVKKGQQKRANQLRRHSRKHNRQ